MLRCFLYIETGIQMLQRFPVYKNRHSDVAMFSVQRNWHSDVAMFSVYRNCHSDVAIFSVYIETGIQMLQCFLYRNWHSVATSPVYKNRHSDVAMFSVQRNWHSDRVASDFQKQNSRLFQVFPLIFG